MSKRTPWNKTNHDNFLDKLMQQNIEAYKNIEFVEEYIDSKTKILAKDSYGLIYVSPVKLLSG